MAVHIVKMSADNRVTIPKPIRRALALRPGQRMAVGIEGGCVQFVPIDEARALRGTLKGIDTSVEREPHRA
jgi:AbrB family looped-hinge helix DNA binding protein